MAFPQFGYSAVSAALGVGQGSLLLATASGASQGNPICSVAPSRVSEIPSRGGDSPSSTPPANASAMCPCYPPSAAALLGLPRPPGLPVDSAAAAALYSGGYPGCYFPLPGDPSAFLVGPAGSGAGELKGGPELGMLPGSPYFGGFESGSLAAAYSPYANSFALDPNARRKNATRESTNTLKAWLHEHRKNPYPTKGEKIMLAIITKMTLTQVSTWFANARRRLKKENKVTWSPRNRCDDDDDDDDKEACDANDDDHHADPLDSDVDIENDDPDADGVPCSPLHYTGQPSPALRLPPVQTSTPISSPRATVTSPSQQRGTTPDNDVTESPKTTPVTSNRPKIWSMAELASSKDDDKTSVGEDKEVPRLSGPLLASPHPAFTNRTDMYNLSKTGGAFSAFRPPHQAVPSQAPTSAPGHLLAAGHPGAVGGHLPRPGWPHALPPSHPAYSYALTQHYLAMTAAAAAAGQRAANPSGPMLNGVQTTAAAQLGHLQTAMLQAVAQQHAAAQEGSQRSDKDARDASPPAARGGAPQTEKRDSPQLTSHRLQQSPPSYSLHQSPPLQAFRHPLSSS